MSPRPGYAQGMATSGKSGAVRPPGPSARPTRVQLEQRVDLAAAMLAAGRSRMAIVGELTTRYGIALRSADRVLAAARRRCAAESEGARREVRERMLARLDALSTAAESRGAYAAAVAAERLKADVVGLKSPAQLDVRTTVAPVPLEPERSVGELAAEMVGDLDLIAESVRKGWLKPTPELRAEVTALLAVIDEESARHARLQ